MKRTIIVVVCSLFAGAVQAAPGIGDAAYQVLSQMGQCLEFARGEVAGMSLELLPPDSSRLFSLHELVATLGIGALTVLFFVPAALVAEWFMRRAEQGGDSCRDI